MAMSHLFNFTSQHNSDLDTAGKLALIKARHLPETHSFHNMAAVYLRCFLSPDEATCYVLHCSNDKW